MSKSLGNFVNTPEVFGKQGADAARQWAASGGSTGTDIPFRWEDVDYGRRFMTKLWNACRFSSMRLEDYDVSSKAEPELLDRWILSKLQKTIKVSTEAMENCEWMNATEVARNFTWHILCDDYLEATKYRLYGEGESKRAAQRTLHQTIRKTLQLLAPIVPHLTEEIHSTMYAESGKDSIHLSKWPEYDEAMVDEEAERVGDTIMAVISETRKQKNKLGISLNKSVKKLIIYTTDRSKLDDVKLGIRDISETMKCESIDLEEGAGEVTVEGYEGLSLTLMV